LPRDAVRDLPVDHIATGKIIRRDLVAELETATAEPA
jgi:hypothetical protein